jgi:glycosyltransferase involved in cell wall biosynthesis
MDALLLTHYYPPEVGAPQMRIARLANGLTARGVRVTVHTGFPHYPAGKIAKPYRNRPWTREHLDGVTVVRSAVYAAANRGTARRLADHAVFAVSALATFRASGPADVVVAETPPLFTAGAAIAYARLKRAPLVLNVADRWPESAVQLGAIREGRASAAAERLERAAYKAAARITVPTTGLVEALDAVPEARAKVVHMPPAVDLERFDPAPREAGEPLRVLYAGTVGLAQGVGTLVDAARLTGDSVHVTIAGDGADAASVGARAGGLSNVRVLGAVPSDRIPSLYADTDVAVVLLLDRPLFEAALPTKMLEAMAAGRGLVLAARGEAASLVESSGAGIVVPPEDPAALADALQRIASDPRIASEMGRAGRALAEQRFGREQSVDRWLELLESVSRR